MIKYFYLTFLVFFSCQMGEIPIDPHDSESMIVDQITMQSDYRNQVFYNLDNCEEISQNIKDKWDLLFYFSDTGNYIILNSSNYMFDATMYNLFEDQIDTFGLVFNSDNSNGDFNSLSINSLSPNESYVIDRGVNLNGGSRGFKKIMIESSALDSVSIKVSNLNNTDLEHFTIYKNPNDNLVTFSFDLGVVSIFPDETSWDLLFTRYTYQFPDSVTYLVTGVLTNYLNGVSVAIDTINEFTSINFDDLSSYNFLTYQDIIGYDWKYYNFSNNTYTIVDNLVYIIKDVKGFYYKLKFIGFYNYETGEKGFPEFEIQKL